MGYKRSSIPPEQGNDCVEYRFDLFLDNDIDKPHQSWLTVTFYLSGDEDSVCQYVEVGKKEVPVMELRCGGKPVDLVNEEEVSAS